MPGSINADYTEEESRRLAAWQAARDTTDPERNAAARSILRELAAGTANCGRRFTAIRPGAGTLARITSSPSTAI